MKTETEIRYSLVDPTAAADGVVTVTQRQPWADPASIHGDEQAALSGKWATGEHNAFCLDGTCALFPDTPSEQDMGLWSQNRTDENGCFASPPVLTISFSAPHTSIGITLLCSAQTNDWASEVTIAWYSASGAQLAQQDFAPDSAAYLCDRLVQDYRKVIITFHKTNKPCRYLKLFRVIYGVVEELTDSDITEATLVEECDGSGATVRVNTFRFGFYAKRRFDLLETSGVYTVFRQQQRVQVRQRVDGEVRELGRYYTDVPEVQEERVVIMDCIDLLGVLTQTEYMGGLWLSGIAAGELIAEIMSSAGFAEEYELEAVLAGITVQGYLPICTHREALRQVAFAIGGEICAARRDKLYIRKPVRVVRLEIHPFDKAIGHLQRQRPYVSGVEVYTHSYVPAEQQTQLFKATCKAGEQMVRFGSPATALDCTGADIKESGVNYAVLTVRTAGEVVLMGTAYEEQVSLGGSVYAVNMPAGAHANVKTVEDCTLTADAQAVAQRLYAYCQKRIENSGELFPVNVVAGDVVTVHTKDSRSLAGVLESAETSLYNGGITKAVIVGG